MGSALFASKTERTAWMRTKLQDFQEGYSWVYTGQRDASTVSRSSGTHNESNSPQPMINPSMRLLLAVALSSLLFGGSMLNAQSLDTICSGIGDIAKCSAIITLPTGAKLKTSRNKMINNIDICKAITEAIPGVPDLLKKAGGMCSCLLEVINLAATSAAISGIFDTGDVTGAASGILKQFADLGQCMSTNAFDVKDNKNELIQAGGPLALEGNVIVFKAQELDLSTYAQSAAVLATCFFPGPCNEPLIEGFFTQYLSDSERLMSNQVKEFLLPLQNALNTVSGQIGGIKTEVMTLPESVKATRAEINKIVERICRDNATCTDGAFVRLREAGKLIDPEDVCMLLSNSPGLPADETLGITETVAKAQETFDDAVAFANSIVQGVNSAMDAFSNLQDFSIAGIVTLIVEKKLTKVEDVVGLLQVSKRLPSPLGDIQSVLPTLQGVASGIQAHGAQLGAMLDSPGPPSLRRGKQIQDLLNGLQGRGVGGVWEFKVASYRRWFDISLDMPCTTTGRASYTIAGWKTSFDYPKFYSCPYTKEIPFPNHHIPYVKLQLGNSKRSIPAFDTLNEVVTPSATPLSGLESYHEILQDTPVSRRISGGFWIMFGTAAALTTCGACILAIARRIWLKDIQKAREEVKSAEKDRLLA
ncbi:hypothetical protein QFC20_007520 [Naganishia adeliensis]|uniref:Uncharacterized protein n=1 Tax=Naganishia adeliensis TaxID=92952 RepID=A0ACC2UYH0_9TREE|nr:hypothetical protein QFC20_007520 [Naganishia adeliensis]